MDPDPAIFISDLKDVNKEIIFASYFLKGVLTLFCKEKKS
jgi:hypothetical protein